MVCGILGNSVRYMLTVLSLNVACLLTLRGNTCYYDFKMFCNCEFITLIYIIK